MSRFLKQFVFQSYNLYLSERHLVTKASYTVLLKDGTRLHKRKSLITYRVGPNDPPRWQEEEKRLCHMTSITQPSKATGTEVNGGSTK